MATPFRAIGRLRWIVPRLAFGIWVSMLSACAQPPLIGIIYTHVKLPLTEDVHNTIVPDHQPPSGKILEIREPVTGAGFYARVNSNAIGDIAKNNGIEKLYFADQEIFSVLGIWTTNKVHLYGD